MPIVLKHGKGYKKSPRFSLTKVKITCHGCQCKFRIAETDLFTLGEGEIRMGTQVYTICCPECGALVQFDGNKNTKERSAH